VRRVREAQAWDLAHGVMDGGIYGLLGKDEGVLIQVQAQDDPDRLHHNPPTYLSKALDLGHHDAHVLGLVHVPCACVVDLVVGINDKTMDAMPVVHTWHSWLAPDICS